MIRPGSRVRVRSFTGGYFVGTVEALLWGDRALVVFSRGQPEAIFPLSALVLA